MTSELHDIEYQILSQLADDLLPALNINKYNIGKYQLSDKHQEKLALKFTAGKFADFKIFIENDKLILLHPLSGCSVTFYLSDKDYQSDIKNSLNNLLTELGYR